MERLIYFFKEQLNDSQLYWGDSVASTVVPLDEKKLAGFLCDGETIVVRPKTKEMIRFSLPDIAHNQPQEPTSEHALQGSREGLVESADINLALLRKRIKSHKLVVREKTIGAETNTKIYSLYMDDLVDREALLAY